MNRIRIGHIGTKHDHSSGKLDCVKKFPDVFEVVGIVEEDSEQREKVKNLPSYRGYPFLTEEQLFNAGCDCMMIEGFEHDLPHVAKRCVEQGFPVHIDKPAGRDLQVFEEMLHIAENKNLPVQMAYMYRYNPAVQDCREMIHQGRLGDLLNVTAIMNTSHDTAKRQWLERFQGGIMFFLGCHMVDLIHEFQGMPQKVTPYLRNSGVEHTTSIDQATAIFEYPSGISIAQANACEINGYGRRQLVVCGTEGTYEIRPLERPIGVQVTEKAFAKTFEDRHMVKTIETVPAENRYDAMMLDFAAMVRGEKENPFNYEYELQTQKLVLAACGCLEDIS